MTDERRYDDDEVAEIFEIAAAPVSRRDARRTNGLTLTELQAIGREVGIAPDRIAEAASALERSHSAVPRRTDFGMPISVGRTTELPRQLTDREWALLVADLRETFGARGKDSSQGDTRQWTNGNLHAFVEPTLTGYRLRLGSLKGDAVPSNRLGVAGIGMGLVTAMTLLASGDLVTGFSTALMLGGMGAGTFAWNAVRLPRWARERERQMTEIIDRTHAMLGAVGKPRAPADGSAPAPETND